MDGGEQFDSVGRSEVGDEPEDAGDAIGCEQYERHTAWDRPGGVANQSGAGDLDVIIYSARKWARAIKLAV